MNNLRTSTESERPGLQRERVTLSLTPDEYKAWDFESKACGMKLTRWAPVSINRLLTGIPPVEHVHPQKQLHLPAVAAKRKKKA